LAQAYGIQESISSGLGAIGGWRICQAGSQAKRACAPLPLASLRPEPARLVIGEAASVRLKAGICFRVGRSLADYDAPYTREQVLAAIASCHPAVDVLQPPIAALEGDLPSVADGCAHDQLVYGRPTPAWWEVNISQIPVSIFQGGRRTFSVVTGPAEDAVSLLQWLANQGTRWSGGLMVSQLATIDLATPEIVIRPDQPARIVLGWLGAITLRFA
ncbi:MAG: hypothetical protein ACREF3_13570, partial [Acetobacteraceae bacterium]